MCFVNDYDWSAEVSDHLAIVEEEDCRCEECGRTIPPGEWHEYVWQREYECCQFCNDRDVDDCECDYGETYECRTCRDCCRFRDAVQATELAEGCAAYEALPPYGLLWEGVQEIGVRESAKYARTFLRMHPGQKPWLVEKWREMFSKW